MNTFNERVEWFVGRLRMSKESSSPEFLVFQHGPPAIGIRHSSRQKLGEQPFVKKEPAKAKAEADRRNQ